MYIGGVLVQCRWDPTQEEHEALSPAQGDGSAAGARDAIAGKQCVAVDVDRAPFGRITEVKLGPDLPNDPHRTRIGCPTRAGWCRPRTNLVNCDVTRRLDAEALLEG